MKAVGAREGNYHTRAASHHRYCLPVAQVVPTSRRSR